MNHTDLIRALQNRLGVTADGIYGPATHKAVMDALGHPVASQSQRLGKAALFYSEVRDKFGPLKQSQVDGFEALLKAMAGWRLDWVAYGLATAWHETAATMQPIKEYGGPAYFKRMYDIEGERPKKARELGNLTSGDGVRYAGRGYVQLTGKANYERFGIADTPDDAMKPDVAARIMVEGMEKGLFTGRKLADHQIAKLVSPPIYATDYVGARRIINGTDKADLIAGYAREFESALKYGDWS